MNWKLWLEGLAFAALSGAATGTAQVITADGNFTPATAKVAVAGAIMGVVAYLKQPAK